jgi:hypothetical protein
MTHGSSADSTIRSLLITSASSIPTTTPITQPRAASPSENMLASKTASNASGAPARPVTGSPKRCSISQECGIASSVVRGSTRVSPTSTPCSGPNAL